MSDALANHQAVEGRSAATIAPFVQALGADAAIKLFLNFGGSVLYLSGRPRIGSRLLDVVGLDGTLALFRQFGSGTVNVPLANAWIARQLDAQRIPRAEIARRLRISRDSLRRYLSAASREAA